MNEFLTHSLHVIILIFLVSTMLSTGLGLTVGKILEPLRNGSLVIKSFAASFILVPLAAVVITRVMVPDKPLKIGLVLLSMVAGAEAGPKIIAIAKGNVAFSVGLLAMQLGVTVIYIPLVLSLFLPEVHVNHGKMLLKLCLAVILPMALGLFLKTRHGAIAERLSPFMHHMSTVFMFLLVALIIILNFRAIVGLSGSRAILAGAIFVATAFIVGYLLGGPRQDTRRTLGFMSGGRNASIALMVASQVFKDPRVLLMITVTVIVMLAILLPAAYLLGRQSWKASTP